MKISYSLGSPRTNEGTIPHGLHISITCQLVLQIALDEALSHTGLQSERSSTSYIFTGRAMYHLCDPADIGDLPAELGCS